MQGVRTTRGCVNCRKRKKGCDLQSPTCGRCQRLNITCNYEARRFTFHYHQGTGSGTGGSPVAPEATAPSQPSTTDVNFPPHSLMRTDFVQLASARFWDIYLPSEDTALNGSIGNVTSVSWIHTVREIAQTNDNVDSALQACIFAGLGSTLSDAEYLRHGTQQYARALRGVNEALQDPALALDDSVLACCRLLSLFELFQRSSSSSGATSTDDNDQRQSQRQDWRKHVEGTCRIVALRGRERHTSPHSRDLYDDVRITAIVHGIVSRKPNSFTMMPWRLPVRTLKDDLWDLASHLPWILELVDQVTAELTNLTRLGDTPNSLLRRQSQEVIRECLKLGAELQAFEQAALNLCGAAQKPASRVGEHHASRESPPHREHSSSLSKECQSHGFGFFYLCMEYWAFSITLYSATVQFHSHIPRLLPDDGHLPKELPIWLDPEPPVHHIATNASHYFGPKAGLWSAQCATHPMIAALGYLARSGQKEEASWKSITTAFAGHPSAGALKQFL